VLGVKINFKKQAKSSVSSATEKTYFEVEKHMINHDSAIPVL